MGGNSCGLNNGVNGNIVGVDPGLSPLATIGDSTATHLFALNSLALDQIPLNSNGCGSTVTSDQLGGMRPGGVACDIGAVEVSCAGLGILFPYTMSSGSQAELNTALQCANSNATADTITLTSDVTLTQSSDSSLGNSGLVPITSEITLAGAGYTIGRDSSYSCDGSDPTFRHFLVTASGDLTLINLTLSNGCLLGSDATAYGGAIHNSGTLTLSQSQLTNSRAYVAGALWNGATGSATIEQSTISHNMAGSGGGIINSNNLLLRNSTVSNNTATSLQAGGIWNASGTLQLLYSTVAANTAPSRGGGVLNSNTLILQGALIADNNKDCENDGTVTNNGDNFIEGTGGKACGISNGSNGSIVGVDPLLGPLQDNGGATPTQALLAGSPAMDAVMGSGCPAGDQRGVARPQGDACDIGAYEAEVQVVICPSWTVTTAAELADCITLANNNESPSPTADIIILGADITLSTALPQITSKITLEGANHVIDGGGSVRIFYVNSGGDFTVNQVTLQNGSATTGGGIYNNGTLTVTNSTLSGNSATALGGGISNDLNGMLVVTNSTFSGNIAYGDGGGISNESNRAIVTNSTFSGNRAEWMGSGSGGGIYNYNIGTLTVTNSTFSGNSVDDSGGGIHNLYGTLTVINSTFSDNSATAYGGGIYNEHTLTVTNSTFADNEATISGGGISSGNGLLMVANSTFSRNTSSGGGGSGGIDNQGTMTLTNNTFSGNVATGSGGGSAIVNGIGGTGKRMYLAGNIFDSDTSVANCVNYDILIDNGYNLSDDATCTNDGIGSMNNATLTLGVLADNGGPTLTHLPGVGSDAIGAIPNGTPISNNGTSWTCDQSATDQRGELRPINSGGACTAGAVEVEQAVTAVVGDVNCDESVTIADALIILQYDVGLRTDSGGCPLGDSATELDAANGDVNDDDSTSLSDALMILQCDVGISNLFCPVTVATVRPAPTATDMPAGQPEAQAQSHQLFLPLITR